MSEKLKNVFSVLLVAMFLLGFLIWSIVLPDTETSTSERRHLAMFPTFSKDSVFSGDFMTGFENWSLDQFPLRNGFRTLKAITAFYMLGQKDNNDVYIVNGQAAKLEYPLNTNSIKYATERFTWIYDRYLEGANTNIYLSIVPDKNYYIADENGYPSLDYARLVDSLRDGMTYAKYIDIFGTLSAKDYYSTDTHWRQENLLCTSEALAQSLGITIDKQFAKKTVNMPFYGVYYGQSALPLPAEELNYITNQALEGMRVFDYETNEYISLYDMEKAYGKDPYEIFLSGSKSLLTIENPIADNDRELILFRDSFGSSIAPLLATGYAKVTLIDVRYLSPNLLGHFVDFTDTDVLFLYSTLVLNNSEMIK